MSDLEVALATVRDRIRVAEVGIEHGRGDRFEVTDRGGRHVALSGESMVTIDSRGVQHAVILRRVRGSTASSVSACR